MIAPSCEETCSIATGSLAESYVQPLLIRFNPPAFIQRRALVLRTLRALVPRCKSLLDVGTGEGGLLSYLVNCDDNVPIEKLVGIDPDLEELDNAIHNTEPSQIHQDELRWRPLEISLYLGGVADIRDEARTFDCITAIEVIEHLDPPDVNALSEVCLGRLRPLCWIVTTPNRDFNEVFKRIDEDPEHVYTREGVDYPMRHDDHRFEMSRSEFELWARQQCDKYHYTVRFTGVGSVENAFSGQEGWRALFPEENIQHTFGQSTQAAIFSPLDQSYTSVRHELHRSGNPPAPTGLRHIVTHSYPWSNEDRYPPTAETTESIVVKSESFFCPLFQRGKDYGNQSEDSVIVDCKHFFETCYDMQRASRFDFDKFLESVPPLMNKILRPSSAEDKALGAYEAEEWQYADDAEPRARLLFAQFIREEEWRTCIKFVYDLSSFSSAGVVEDDDSISTVSGDWHMPLDETTLPTGDWYTAEDNSTSDSYQNLGSGNWAMSTSLTASVVN